MTVFNSTTELYNHFRKTAQALGCNLCFDDKQAEIEAMNKEGTDGKPKCLSVRLGPSILVKRLLEILNRMENIIVKYS